MLKLCCIAEMIKLCRIVKILKLCRIVKMLKLCRVVEMIKLCRLVEMLKPCRIVEMLKLCCVVKMLKLCRVVEMLKLCCVPSTVLNIASFWLSVLNGCLLSERKICDFAYFSLLIEVSLVKVIQVSNSNFLFVQQNYISQSYTYKFKIHIFRCSNKLLKSKLYKFQFWISKTHNEWKFNKKLILDQLMNI